jgi:hypothetical protein
MPENKIYILSTGRTGTTFLQKFFENHYPEFSITHQEKWSRIINVIGNLPIGTKPRLFLIRSAFKLLKKQSWPESTLDPLLAFPIAQLLQNTSTDNVKIVHLVRSPLSFANSFMSWKSASLKKLILHYIIPFWQPSPLFNGVNFLHWIKMSKFDKFCWIWNFKNQKFAHLAYSHNYLRVQLEELTQINQGEHWKQLLEFLELPEKDINYSELVSRKVNKSRSSDMVAKENLDKRKVASCRTYCKNLSLTFGYKV